MMAGGCDVSDLFMRVVEYSPCVLIPDIHHYSFVLVGGELVHV